jgi:hypothetical protein
MEEASRIKIDLGDISLILEARVHGLCRRHLVLRLGPVRPSTPEDRVPNTTAAGCGHTRKVSHIMDLMADQKVAFAVQWTDEVGNPTPAPADATFTFTVDDPALLNLTVNPDGMGGEVAAVGPLGSTILHAVGTADGVEYTADEAINVIAGDAERIAFEFGEPEETTPDQ